MTELYNQIVGPAAHCMVLSGSTLSDQNLDDADDSCALILLAPKTGNLDRIGFSCDAVGTDPPAYNVGIVTVDTGGDPTSTEFTTGSSTTYDFTAIGYHEITLPTAASVTKGDIFAIRVWPTGTAPDATNDASIVGGSSSGTIAGFRFPLFKTFNTSWSTSVNVGIPSIAVRYSDGTWITPALVATSTIAFDWLGSFNSTSNPDERGAKFVASFDGTIKGFRTFIDTAAAGTTVTFKLWDSVDNLLESYVLDNDVTEGNEGWMDFLFDSNVVIRKGNTYRLTIVPDTSNVVFYALKLGDAGQRNFWPDGLNWQYTSRVDAGSWTDDTTRIPMMGLIVNEFYTSGIARPRAGIGI